MGGVDPGNLGSIVFAFFYGLAGCHLWAKRHFVQRLAERFRGVWSRATSPRPEPGQGALGADEVADEGRVHKMMDELRLKHASLGLEVVAVLSGMRACIASIIWGMSPRCSDQEWMVKDTLMTCAIYLPGMLIACGHIRFTVQRANFTYVVMKSTAMLGLLLKPMSPMFYVTAGARNIVRAVLDLMVLNTRLALVMNIAWSSVFVYKVLFDPMQWPLESGTHIGKTAEVLIEVGTLIVLQGFLWFCEHFVETHVRLSLSLDYVKNVHRAVRRMLSVLCDAEVHLMPSLEMLSPSNKVAHLLVPGEGSADAAAAAMGGRTFVDFVDEPDRGRFRSFLSSSEDAAGDGVSPAASLQVHLRDAAGHRFPVDLFHANLPDSQDSLSSGHIIGIRECGTTGRDESVSAAPRGAERPPTKSEDAVTSPSLQPCSKVHWDPGVFKQELNGGGRDDDAASRASSGTSRSILVGREMDLPDLAQIKIKLDAMSSGLEVKGVHFAYKDSRQLGKMPKLFDWIPVDARELLGSWVHDSVNRIGNGRESRPFGPLVLRVPTPGIQCRDNFMVRASEVTLDVDSEEGSQCESDQEQCPEKQEETGFPIVLRLQSMKQLVQRRAHHRSHSGLGHRPKAPRSVHSASSADGEARKLPSISEGALREDGSGAAAADAEVPSD